MFRKAKLLICSGKSGARVEDLDESEESRKIDELVESNHIEDID